MYQKVVAPTARKYLPTPSLYEYTSTLYIVEVDPLDVTYAVCGSHRSKLLRCILRIFIKNKDCFSAPIAKSKSTRKSCWKPTWPKNTTRASFRA